jgi:predicted transcriptional regulator
VAAGRNDVEVFAVNVDRTRGQAMGFLRRVAFELPIVWDNQAQAMGGYDIVSMPTMVVVDAQGTVKWVKTGYSREKKLTELEALLDSMVKP